MITAPVKTETLPEVAHVHDAAALEFAADCRIDPAIDSTNLRQWRCTSLMGGLDTEKENLQRPHVMVRVLDGSDVEWKSLGVQRPS